MRRPHGIMVPSAPGHERRDRCLGGMIMQRYSIGSCAGLLSVENKARDGITPIAYSNEWATVDILEGGGNGVVAGKRSRSSSASQVIQAF
jgi:hypothetical protein